MCEYFLCQLMVFFKLGGEGVDVVGFERLVDDNDVAIEQPCVIHDVAGDAGVEGSLGGDCPKTITT